MEQGWVEQGMGGCDATENWADQGVGTIHNGRCHSSTSFLGLIQLPRSTQTSTSTQSDTGPTFPVATAGDYTWEEDKHPLALRRPPGAENPLWEAVETTHCHKRI